MHRTNKAYGLLRALLKERQFYQLHTQGQMTHVCRKEGIVLKGLSCGIILSLLFKPLTYIHGTTALLYEINIS